MRRSCFRKTISDDIAFFLEKEVIFIHIPKTAGISLYKGLFGCESFGHKTIRYYKKHLNKRQFRKCFKFTVVRNPYDRLLSAYNYLKKGGRGVQSDLEYKSYLEEVKSFEDFVINWLGKDEIMIIEHFFSQSYFLKDQHDKIELDFIAGFEKLDEDFEALSNKLKVSSKLPNLNASEISLKKDFMSKYNPDMINIVNNIYREDFENFGYDML